MRLRRVVAAVLAVLVASPSWAATWEKSVDASGFSGTRPLLCSLSTKLWATQMHGTTNNVPITQWDATNNTITSVTGPTVTYFNEVLGFGCDSTNSRVHVDGRGRWEFFASTANLSSWTQVQQTNSPAQGFGGGVSGFGLGHAFSSVVDTGTDLFDIFTANDNSSSYASPTTINAASGFANYETTGVVVSDVSGTANDYYCGAVIDATTGNAGKLVASGMNGAGSGRWTQSCSGTVRGCDSGVSAHRVYPAFTNGSLCVVHSYNTSTGESYVSAWDSSGVLQIQQTIASTDLRPGAYFNLDGAGAALWAWTSAGVAYKSTGGNFSDASGTTYDITLDGGETLTGCQLVNGTIPVCLTTGGDVWAWRTPINVRNIGGGKSTPSLSGSL